MKTTQKFFRTAVILFMTALVFTACNSENGRDGIDGIDGAPGTQGPAGQDGQDGQDGNANVISRTFTSNQVSWTRLTQYGTNYQIGTLTVPEITQAIINNGAVLVYGNFALSGVTWMALPHSFYENGVTTNYSYSIATGNVKIWRSKSNNVNNDGFPGLSFRVVIIGGKAAGKAKDNGVNLSNYEQVKTYFNLEDEEVSVVK